MRLANIRPIYPRKHLTQLGDRQYIYLNPADDGISLYQGISRWIEKYNHKPHQGISRNKPVQLFKMAA